MKKFCIYILSLLIVGCTDSDTVTDSILIKAINKNIDNEYCITAYSNTSFMIKEPNSILPNGFVFKTLWVIYPKDVDPRTYDYGILTSKKELDVLSEAGLFTKNEGITDDGNNQYYRYVLTSYGNNFARNNNGKHAGVTIDFCYGSRKAIKIINYAKTNINGIDGLKIRYQYIYDDIPRWAKDKNVIENFSQLKYLPKYDEIQLIKSRNGWQRNL